MKLLTTLFLTLIAFAGMSQQRQLMHINVDTLQQFSNKGQNMSQFRHMYTGLLFTTPPAEDLGVRMGQSVEFMAGMRFKKKLTGMFAVYVEGEYNHKHYKMAKGCSQVLPDPDLDICIKYDKEVFNFQSIKSNGGIRINFDPKRGNIIGTYVDLGGGFEYLLGAKYVVAYDVNGWLGSKVKAKYSQLSITNNYNYYATARLGRNRYALVGSYRISDMFDKFYVTSTQPAELTRLNVGVEIGLF